MDTYRETDNSWRKKYIIGTVIGIVCMFSVAILIKTYTEQTVVFEKRQNILIPVIEAIQPKKYNIKFSNENLRCLSEALFHEAGVDTHMGKEAVGIVILNRAEERGTTNLCSVIQEHKFVGGRKVCQFSYHCLPNKKTPSDGNLWADSVYVAIKILNEKFEHNASFIQNATHYHADYIKKPAWAEKMHFIAKIDTHLFYRAHNANTK